jgi:hypothetical protein
MDTKDLKPLSRKEREVLKVARALHLRLGAPPTFSQLRTELGKDGTNHVYARVYSIRGKGHEIPVLPPFALSQDTRLRECRALVRQWREDPTIEPVDVLTLIAELLEPGKQ